MLEQLNKLLETNSIMVRIERAWYRLEEIDMDIDNGTMPIFVTDDAGSTFDCYDMADIEEFDPSFQGFKQMDTGVVGYA